MHVPKPVTNHHRSITMSELCHSENLGHADVIPSRFRLHLRPRQTTPAASLTRNLARSGQAMMNPEKSTFAQTIHSGCAWRPGADSQPGMNSCPCPPAPERYWEAGPRFSRRSGGSSEEASVVVWRRCSWAAVRPLEEFVDSHCRGAGRLTEISAHHEICNHEGELVERL